MKKLNSVTLVCVDCYNHGGAIAALKKSLQEIEVDRAVLFTDRHFKLDGIEVVVIPKIESKDSYSAFMIKELYKYIETDFVLTVQHDGWIICGDAWDDEFYKYDYGGAPWLYIDHRNVGNGAVSWRSKKLIHAVGTDDFIEIVPPEDEILGRLYRRYLEEKYGIKYMPEDLAHKFSYELNEPTQKTFGFHGNFWPPFQETIVIRREGALGDLIMCEPLLHHFWMKGYRVVLDTLPQFYELFRAHYFPVIPFGQLNPKIPYTHINLDMSYESDPQKLHLKAYYEFAGVPENEQIIRNPKLNFIIDHTNTLFPKKYVVLHVDKRAQPGRNIYGIEWRAITGHLSNKGYTVLQIGKGEGEETGAIRMQTLPEPMMVYLIAGAECVIGIDSGPMNAAVATGRKCIVFHGSVDPEFIYPDRSQMRFITNHSKEQPICDKPYCWHSTIGCEGVPCYIDKEQPPCTQFKTQQLIDAINEML